MKKGIRLIVQERDAGLAASVIMPNAMPGHFDVFTQWMSFLLGEQNECAITNGAGRGYLWSGRWLPIDPPKVELVDDIGCGDSFAAAYIIGRVFFKLSAVAALAYALEAAKETAIQIGVAQPLPFRRS